MGEGDHQVRVAFRKLYCNHTEWQVRQVSVHQFLDLYASVEDDVLEQEDDEDELDGMCQGFVRSHTMFTSLAGFIVDDNGEDEEGIVGDSGSCQTQRRAPRFDSVPLDSTQLELLPHFDEADAEVLVRTAKRLCQRRSPSEFVSLDPAALGVLGQIVESGVQWLDAEIERDKVLETTKRGDVSDCFCES